MMWRSVQMYARDVHTMQHHHSGMFDEACPTCLACRGTLPLVKKTNLSTLTRTCICPCVSACYWCLSTVLVLQGNAEQSLAHHTVHNHCLQRPTPGNPSVVCACVAKSGQREQSPPIPPHHSSFFPAAAGGGARTGSSLRGCTQVRPTNLRASSMSTTGDAKSTTSAHSFRERGTMEKMAARKGT